MKQKTKKKAEEVIPLPTWPGNARSPITPDLLGEAMIKAQELGWKDFIFKDGNRLIRTAAVAGAMLLTSAAFAQRVVGVAADGGLLLSKCDCPPSYYIAPRVHSLPLITPLNANNFERNDQNNNSRTGRPLATPRVLPLSTPREEATRAAARIVPTFGKNEHGASVRNNHQ